MDPLTKRNTETALQVINAQNKKLEEQEKRINQLNEAVSTLSNRLNELEKVTLFQKVQLTGRGPSV